MDRQTTAVLRVGDWRVNPASGHISRNGQSTRVEVRTMRLLLCLANHPGEVLSISDLLEEVWPDVAVAPESVYQAVTSLRRVLGDDPKQPAYIETVPRLGYKLVAAVGPWTEPPSTPSDSQRQGEIISTALPAGAPNNSGSPIKSVLIWTVTVALCIALAGFSLFHGKPSNRLSASSITTTQPPQNSLAVLPFLDLTEDMNQEPFADGVTEELIDKLSKTPVFRYLLLPLRFISKTNKSP